MFYLLTLSGKTTCRINFTLYLYFIETALLSPTVAMVSLRFPFLFSQPPRIPNPSNATTSRPFSATAAAAFAVVAATAGAASVACVAASKKSEDTRQPFLLNALSSLFSGNFLPMWGSLSLADNSSPVVESKTGVAFPAVIGEFQRLLGVGVRKKSVLGLKNIDVYAFGVYADHNNIKNLLGEKYGMLSISELKESKEFNEDLMQGDICMTVRLQIVYRKLSIRSVRSAFEESVGTRLQKFGGSDNKELLQRFTSLFKDEYKIPRGSVIELSKEQGNVLCTKIDGVVVGSIQSKLLCRSILDLYIGEDPLDIQAKADIQLNLASLLQK